MAKTVQVKNIPTFEGLQKTGNVLGYGQIIVGKTAVPFPESLNPTNGLYLSPVSGIIYAGDVLVTTATGFLLPEGAVTLLPIASTAGIWFVSNKNNRIVSWYAV